jgi:hypothetical protein
MLSSARRKEAISMKYRTSKEERAYAVMDEKELRRLIRHELEALNLRQLQRILWIIETKRGC